MVTDRWIVSSLLMPGLTLLTEVSHKVLIYAGVTKPYQGSQG